MGCAENLLPTQTLCYNKANNSPNRNKNMALFSGREPLREPAENDEIQGSAINATEKKDIKAQIPKDSSLSIATGWSYAPGSINPETGQAYADIQDFFRWLLKKIEKGDAKDDWVMYLNKSGINSSEQALAVRSPEEIKDYFQAAIAAEPNEDARQSYRAFLEYLLEPGSQVTYEGADQNKDASNKPVIEVSQRTADGSEKKGVSAVTAKNKNGADVKVEPIQPTIVTQRKQYPFEERRVYLESDPDTKKKAADFLKALNETVAKKYNNNLEQFMLSKEYGPLYEVFGLNSDEALHVLAEKILGAPGQEKELEEFNKLMNASVEIIRNTFKDEHYPARGKNESITANKLLYYHLLNFVQTGKGTEILQPVNKATYNPETQRWISNEELARRATEQEEMNKRYKADKKIGVEFALARLRRQIKAQNPLELATPDQLRKSIEALKKI